MKYVPGPLVGQLSGSQGSTTASHNRYGSYLRNRVIPVNPSTSAQIARRNNFGEVASHWRTLTATEIAGWEALGIQIVRTDSQGQTYTLNGFGAFMDVNINRKLFGLSIVVAAPLLGTLEELVSLDLVATAGVQLFTFGFLPTPIGAGKRLKIEASRPLGQGITFVGKGDIRALSYTADNIASPVDVTSAWTSRFGPLIADQKILALGTVVNSSFISGPPLQKFVTVAP